MGVTKLIGIFFIFLILGIGTGGAYIYLNYQSGDLPVPTVESINNEWGRVTEHDTEIKTTIKINNPSEVSIPIDSVGFNLEMNGIQMAKIASKDIDIPPGKSSEIEIVTSIDNTRISTWWYSHLKHNEYTKVELTDIYIESFGVKIPIPYKYTHESETDILGSAPTNIGGQEVSERPTGVLPAVWDYVKPKAPKIENIDYRWGQITPSTTEIISEVTVYNPNIMPVITSQLGYLIFMNDVEMVEGQTDDLIVIEPKGRTTIKTTTQIGIDKIPKWWVSHINNGEETKIEIIGEIIFDIDIDTEILNIPFLPRYNQKVRLIELPFVSYKQTFNTTLLESEI